ARWGFLTTGLAVFILWNLATAAGALVGTRLGDPRIYGLDAAVGAAFLALLWPRLTHRQARLVAIVAAATALCLIPLTPPGVPVLAAGGLAIVAGLGVRRDRAGQLTDRTIDRGTGSVER
ncbi:MAG: AzlC family ABC transporter permease, partial [Nocardioides sp.]